MAMHPVMDEFSPTHQCQVHALGIEPLEIYGDRGYTRVGKRGGVPEGTMREMTTVIQMNYIKTFVTKIYQ